MNTDGHRLKFHLHAFEFAAILSRKCALTVAYFYYY